MKQIFLASTFFELVCLAAGIDSGEFDSAAVPALLGTGGVSPAAHVSDDPASGTPSAEARERILLVSNNSAILELSASLVDTPGAESLLRRFDRIVDLNESLAPAHPSSWRPAQGDLPMVEAHLRRIWDLGTDDVELVLESPQVNPAIALGRVFSRATIRVHADGLMSYGPTRNRIPLTNGQRMSTLHYLPLAPGLEPRLLAEFGIVGRPMSVDAFRRVVTEVGEHTAGELDSVLSADLCEEPWAFAVGQYLSALGLITEDEETELHVSMILEAARRGHSRVVFKPHPAAPPARLAPLCEAAERSGITLDILDLPILAEVVIDRLRPGLILGGFSTALATARGIYGIPAIAVGSSLLLEKLTPYQNSNRIPLTIISELCKDGTTAEVLQDLVNAVSYCMAPELSREQRLPTIAFLDKVFDAQGSDTQGADSHGAGRLRRYFKKKRLRALGLPCGTEQKLAPRRLVRRTGAVAYQALTRKQRRVALRLQG